MRRKPAPRTEKGCRRRRTATSWDKTAREDSRDEFDAIAGEIERCGALRAEFVQRVFQFSHQLLVVPERAEDLPQAQQRSRVVAAALCQFLQKIGLWIFDGD